VATQLPIQATQVPALNDLALPFSNWSYAGTLITSAAWTVFVWFYSLPNTIPQNSGQTLLYGPVVATITVAGAGSPVIPAQYLTPQSLFMARTQAFNTGSLVTPPTDDSFKLTFDLFVRTSG
jgi:hypothetical protein